MPISRGQPGIENGTLYVRTMGFGTIVADLVLGLGSSGTEAPVRIVRYTQGHGPGLRDRGRTHSGLTEEVVICPDQKNTFICGSRP